MIIITPKTKWQRFKVRMTYWAWWKWKWWVLRKLGSRTIRIIIYHSNLGMSIDDIVCAGQMCYKANEPTKFNWEWAREPDRVMSSLKEMKRQTKYVEIPPRFGVPEDEEDDKRSD